ncbi:MAG: hypothetical protein KDH15_02110 [Rhodocyclaceae bacterium]|nr:hypothetical protein [Rhodocyclaceae bacterium]
MPAERLGAALLLLAGCLLPLRTASATDAPPSPELLELLGELADDEDAIAQLDILATDDAPVPTAEASDED